MLANESLINPKKWWYLMKCLLKDKQNLSIPPLCVNNVMISDNLSKANHLNDFFINITKVEEAYDTLPLLDPLTETNLPYTFSDITIEEYEVLDQLKKLDLSKSYGPDGIPPKLLKEAGNTISKSLCTIFNRSIKKGMFPQLWKLANVHPLFKNGDPMNITNYRPVSVLNIVSKVFEKIMYKHFYNFFIQNNCITQEQSGFLPNVSTISQLCELTHEITKNMAANKDTIMVFLDISKAFDKVWHKGLIYKLCRLGINGNLLKWTTSYLTERKQRVMMNGLTSEWGILRGGVPQGSVLGPLFFLIYINDLVTHVEKSSIRLFADDTCLFTSGLNYKTLLDNLNHDLNNIQCWSDRWLVSFSPKKTEAMLLTQKNKQHKYPMEGLYFFNKQIDFVSSHRHLGLILDRNMSWKNHINHISSSTSRMLNVMKSLKYKLDRLSLEKIYCYYIRPKLEYGDILFAGAPQSLLSTLD
jgi:hypothetical protein